MTFTGSPWLDTLAARRDNAEAGMLWNPDRGPSPAGLLPINGATGQALEKRSDNNYDVYWATIPDPEPAVLDFAGTWTEGQTYTAGQVVNFEDALYVALVTTAGSPGDDPSDWLALTTAQLPTGVPPGGTTGQVLAKLTDGDYATRWEYTPPAVFADADERDSLWPDPPAFAECYLADSGTPWVYNNGAWTGKPMGLVASTIAAAGSYPAPSNIALIDFTAYAGRRYLITGCTQFSPNASGLARAELAINGVIAAWMVYQTSANPGTSSFGYAGSATVDRLATTTGTMQIVIYSNSTVSVTIGNDTTRISVFDIGS